MVKVAFYHQSSPDQPQLRLTVIPGQQVGVEGDASWIDWSLPAPSERLGRSVTFQEDAQEWARSLPGLYNSGGWTVRIESDDAQPAAAGATAAAAAGGVGVGTALYGTPSAPGDRIARASEEVATAAATSRRRSPVFVIGAVVVLGIAGVLAFKGLAGGKKDKVNPPAMTQPLPATPPATPQPKPTPTTKLPTTPPTTTPPATTPPATTPPATTQPPATTPPATTQPPATTPPATTPPATTPPTTTPPRPGG